MAGRLNKVDSWLEVPDHYKPLSRWLNKVPGEIVFSPAERDQNVKQMKILEKLASFDFSFTYLGSSHRMEDKKVNGIRPLDIVMCFEPMFSYCDCHRMENLISVDGFRFPISIYICGSRFEGTTSRLTLADVDSVCIPENKLVVTNRLDARQYPGCFMLVQDSYTPAGYAKLQCVHYGLPLLEHYLISDITKTFCRTDAEGRVVIPSYKKLFYIPADVDYHGPAATLKGPFGCVSMDYVVAIRSKTWPDCAGEWLTRQRLHNWPTQEKIKKCKTLGCLFVQVGHPNSSENHLEWRISFTLQERLLVTDFNAVQLKCYVLLKMIKREKIHITLAEKCLTSYHLKTCMLYMIENTPAEFWVEDNLLACLYNSLYKLQRWVEAGDCPNYFIPEENMFEGRLTNQQQVQLGDLLRNLSMNITSLWDMFDYRLQYFGGLPMSQLMLIDSTSGVQISRLKVRNKICSLCDDKHAQVCFLRLYKLKLSLERTGTVSEDTREAVSLIVPYIDIMLMSFLIVLAKRLSKSKKITFTMINEKWDAPSFDHQRFELKLKQASLMHMLGHSELSLEILVAHKDQVRRQISVCACNFIGEMTNVVDRPPFRGSKLMPLEAMLSGHFINCLVFLPAEADLAPLALCYEMYRSVGCPPEGKEWWYDWAVVDGKVWLYFLLYLNHRQLGMEAHAAVDIDDIRRLIQADESLGHRETAYNLLGWIYKERELVDRAIECFQESLAIMPMHNAALWQLAFVLSAKVTRKMSL